MFSHGIFNHQLFDCTYSDFKEEVEKLFLNLKMKRVEGQQWEVDVLLLLTDCLNLFVYGQKHTLQFAAIKTF